MNTTTRTGPKYHRRYICENPHCRDEFKPGSRNALGLCSGCYQYYRIHGTHRTRKRKRRVFRQPTAQEVAAFRKRWQAGERQKDLAAEYGVSVSTMGRWLRTRPEPVVQQPAHQCKRCEILVEKANTLCRWCIEEGYR